MNTLQLLLIAIVLPVLIGHAGGLKPVCKNEDGSLNNTFANHGKVITPVAVAGSQAQGVVVLPCGRIVAAGFTFPSVNSTRDFALVGYTSYGAIDDDFGVNGIVFTHFGAVLPGAVVLQSNDQAYAVALQSNCNGCDDRCGDCCDNSCNGNDKIVVVGSSDVLGTKAFAVARYNGDGTLDTTFGMDGSGVMVIPIEIMSEAFAVAIQADNKIVVAGYAQDGMNTDFAVVRLDCNGTLDTTFGCDSTGIVTIDFGRFDKAFAVKIQKNGKIVVAGQSNAHGSFDYALVRLMDNGTLDKNFGVNGKVLTDFSSNNTSQDSVNALVLIEDCGTCCNNDPLRIVAVGLSNRSIRVGSQFSLAGYTDSGDLDKNFGSDGLAVTEFIGSESSNAKAAVLQRDCAKGCKIVVGGILEATGFHWVLARYTLDGSLDPYFGIDGTVRTDFFNGTRDQAFAVALQANGNIIAAGSSNAFSTQPQFALASYTVCNRCCVQCGLACSSCK